MPGQRVLKQIIAKNDRIMQKALIKERFNGEWENREKNGTTPAEVEEGRRRTRKGKRERGIGNRKKQPIMDTFWFLWLCNTAEIKETLKDFQS